MKFTFPYTLKAQNDSGFLVQFVDFEEAFTEGATEEEAAFNTAEVLSLIIEQRTDDGVDIPAQSARKHRRVACPQASVQVALLMRKTREEQGKSLADMARALHPSWPSAQHLEQPEANPALRQLERAAAALGKRLVVGLS